MKTVNFFFSILTLAAVILIFTGCSTTKEITSKEKTEDVSYVKIEDHTVQADIIQDTLQSIDEVNPPIVVDESSNQVIIPKTPRVYKGRHGTITYYPDRDSMITSLQPEEYHYTDTNKYQSHLSDKASNTQKDPGFFEQLGITLKFIIIGGFILVILGGVIWFFINIKKSQS